MVAIFTIRFNSQNFYGLAKECIYVFCEDIRTNRALFPRLALGDWFVCIVEREREFTARSEMSVQLQLG